MHGLCGGLNEGAACQEHEECKAGFYCEGACKAQKKAGDVDCKSDEYCVNDSGCNGKKCVPYYSLSEGSELDQCHGNRNILCKSATCVTNNYKSVCISDVKSSKAPPATCSSNKDCVSDTDKRTGLNFTTECVCSSNGLGVAYCSLTVGDSFKVEDWTKKWLESKAIKKCNTARRFNERCMETYWD